MIFKTLFCTIIQNNQKNNNIFSKINIKTIHNINIFFHKIIIIIIIKIMKESKQSGSPQSLKRKKSKMEQNPHETYFQTILDSYGITEPFQLIQIMINPKNAQNYKKKQFEATLNSSTKLQNKAFKKKKQFKQLATNHTYEQLYLYFQSKQILNQCRKVLREKLQREQMIKGHEIRKKIWILLSGSKQKKQRSKQYYQLIKKFTQYPDYYFKPIRDDVVRTVDLKDPQQYQNGQLKLHTMLISYARRNPYIGYCQGMNFIAHFIQLMQFTDENAFWLFSSLIEDILPMDYYTNMVGVATDIKIISDLIKLLLPKIAEKLEILKIDISIFMLEWLVCLFTTSLPFYLTKIVWDFIMIDGSATLLKTCVLVLETFQQEILGASDFSQLLICFDKNKKRNPLSQQELVKKLLSIFIDNDILNIARLVYRSQIDLNKRVTEQPKSGNQKVQKWKNVNCNIDWPICFQALHKNKDENEENQIWTIRRSGPPKIIKDYIDDIRKYKPSQQVQQPENQLLIGRIPHICDAKNYEKRQTNVSRDIQMGKYQNVVDSQGKMIWKPQSIDNVEPISFSSLDFYRRATNGRLMLFGKYG